MQVSCPCNTHAQSAFLPLRDHLAGDRYSVHHPAAWLGQLVGAAADRDRRNFGRIVIQGWRAQFLPDYIAYRSSALVDWRRLLLILD